jgi:hypothetical protein
MKRRLTVGGTVYRLTRGDDVILSAGLCRSAPLPQIIVDTLGGSANETLFHELFHACEHELVRHGKLSADSPETYVEDMALIFYRTLLRNGFLSMDVEWEQLELAGLEEPDVA